MRFADAGLVGGGDMPIAVTKDIGQVHPWMRISAMAATDFNLIADSVSLRRRTAFHRDRGHRRGRPSDRADVSAGGYRGG
jgi:hypothetical protein